MLGTTLEDVDARVKQYRQFDIFKNMSKQKLGNLTYAFQERNYTKGTYLYREGSDEIDGVYFLIRGTLERVKEDQYDKLPQRVVRGENLRVAKEGSEEQERHALVHTLASGSIVAPLDDGLSGSDLHPIRKVIPGFGIR